MQKHTCASR